jgi:hypothetical protein
MGILRDLKQLKKDFAKLVQKTHGMRYDEFRDAVNRGEHPKRLPVKKNGSSAKFVGENGRFSGGARVDFMRDGRTNKWRKEKGP